MDGFLGNSFFDREAKSETNCLIKYCIFVHITGFSLNVNLSQDKKYSCDQSRVNPINVNV